MSVRRYLIGLIAALCMVLAPTPVAAEICPVVSSTQGPATVCEGGECITYTDGCKVVECDDIQELMCCHGATQADGMEACDYYDPESVVPSAQLVPTDLTLPDVTLGAYLELWVEDFVGRWFRQPRPEGLTPGQWQWLLEQWGAVLSDPEPIDTTTPTPDDAPIPSTPTPKPRPIRCVVTPQGEECEDPDRIVELDALGYTEWAGFGSSYRVDWNIEPDLREVFYPDKPCGGDDEDPCPGAPNPQPPQSPKCGVEERPCGPGLKFCCDISEPVDGPGEGSENDTGGWRHQR